MADTYNPIIGREKLKGWRLFNERPAPEPGTALVLGGNGHPLLTVEHGDRLGAGELRWAKYDYCYRVDTSDHRLGFACVLPCKTDAFDFSARVEFVCSVHDPAVVVRRNVTDVRGLLEPLITDVMRDMSREYDLEESARAEREIGERLSGEVFDEGFEVSRLTLGLSMDAEAREYLRQKRKIRTEKDLKLDDINSQREIQRAEQARREEADKFDLKLMETKMKFYGTVLQSGNLQLLALQLAQSPNDLALVVKMLNEQKQAANEHQFKMLQMLLEEDALEGSQLNDVRKRLLQELGGLFKQSLPAVGESSAAEPRQIEGVAPEEGGEGSGVTFPDELSRRKDG